MSNNKPKLKTDTVKSGTAKKPAATGSRAGVANRLRLQPKHMAVAGLAIGILGVLFLLRSSAAVDITRYETETGDLTGDYALIQGEPNTSGDSFVSLNKSGEPSPSPSPNPSIPPTGFPDETNTGPASTPTQTWPDAPSAGGVITVSDNADGYTFNGCVKTGRAGVVIKNSVIRGNCPVMVLHDEGGNGVFENNDIIDEGGFAAATIGCGNNSVFKRNNADGGDDGAKADTNCKLLENYIHDHNARLLSSGDGTHNDGVQIESGSTSGMVIQGNTFANTCTNFGVTGGCAGVVFINGGASNHQIIGNYVKRWDGNAAGFIFHTANGGSNIIIKDNVFECGSMSAPPPHWNMDGPAFYSGGASVYENNGCRQ